MKVVILCGGKGTRIREETEYKPKPMIEIGGRPILWHIMKHYSAFGFNEFILCLGYKYMAVKEYFLNYQLMNCDFTISLNNEEPVICHTKHEDDWNLTLVNTGLNTKKGTRIKQIEAHLTGERFMVTYGDGIADVDIGALIAEHEKSGKLVTFTGVHPVSRFATVDYDSEGNISDWHEKKQLEGYINGGFFVLDRRILDYIEGDMELEEEPMKRLAKEGNLGMYHHNGFWQCMDTYRDYTFLNQLWDTNKAPWRIWD